MGVSWTVHSSRKRGGEEKIIKINKKEGDTPSMTQWGKADMKNDNMFKEPGSKKWQPRTDFFRFFSG